VKYMLFIYPDPTIQLSADVRAGIPAAVSAWVAEIEERRVRLLGDVLQPVSEAATVEVRDGEASVRRGPVTDAERQISGFNILDCEDLDEALEVAGKHPVASFGTLELRPFAES
jgi:hypothetical protein